MSLDTSKQFLSFQVLDLDTGITVVSGVLTDHSGLSSLDYASAGHTGFAASAHVHVAYLNKDGSVALTGPWYFGSQTISGTGDIYGGDFYGDGSNLTGIGVSDHGSLTGLADDDHAQYVLVDGSRSITDQLTISKTGGYKILEINDADGASAADAQAFLMFSYGAGPTNMAYVGFESATDPDMNIYNIVGTTKIYAGDGSAALILEAIKGQGIEVQGDVKATTTLTIGSQAITEANLTDLLDSGATTLHKHDHGGMDGLGDDDHTQYYLADGTRNLSGDINWTANSPTMTATATSTAMIFQAGTNGYIYLRNPAGPFAAFNSAAITTWVDIKPQISGTLDIGSTTHPFAEGYFDDIYVKGSSLHIGDNVVLSEFNNTDLNINQDIYLSGTSPAFYQPAGSATVTFRLSGLGGDGTFVVADSAGASKFRVSSGGSMAVFNWISFQGDHGLVAPPGNDLTIQLQNGSFNIYDQLGSGNIFSVDANNGNTDIHGNVTVSGYVGWDTIQMSEPVDNSLRVTANSRSMEFVPYSSDFRDRIIQPRGSSTRIVFSFPDGGTDAGVQFNNNSDQLCIEWDSNSSQLKLWHFLDKIVAYTDLTLNLDNSGVDFFITDTNDNEIFKFDQDGNADIHGNVTVSGYVGWDTVQLSEYNDVDLQLNSDVYLSQANDTTFYSPAGSSTITFKLANTGGPGEFIIADSTGANKFNVTSAGLVECKNDAVFAHGYGPAATSGWDLYITMGDAIGAKKVSFRDFADAEVASIDSNGNADFHGNVTVSGYVGFDNSVQISEAAGDILFNSDLDFTGTAPTISCSTGSNNQNLTIISPAYSKGGGNINVKLGDTGGLAKFSFQDSGGVEGAWVDSDGNASFADILFGANTISGTGDIHCADLYTSGSSLHVGTINIQDDAGTLKIDSEVEVSVPGNANTFFDITCTAGYWAQFRLVDGSNVKYEIGKTSDNNFYVYDYARSNNVIRTNAEELTLYYGGSPKLATSSTGVTVTGDLTTAGNLIPTVSGTYDVGTEEKPWTQVYLADQATGDVYGVTIVSGTLTATLV